MTPGVSISNSEVGLAALSIGAFFLRLICTNGLVAKTEVSASYRHVSTRILDDFPVVMERMSRELAGQKDQFRFSMESPVDDPLATIGTFQRQFQLNKTEQEAVEWGHTMEPGGTMFHVVQAFTRAAQFKCLCAESRHRLQRVGGSILGMLKKGSDS